MVAPPGPDFVTILTSRGPRLTKRWYLGPGGDPQCEEYGKAKHFDFTEKPITGLDDLKRILGEIGPKSCLILGRLKDGVDPTNALRRLHDHKLDDGTVKSATIEDAAHYWLPIDVDGVDACDDKGEFDPVKEPERAVYCVLGRLPQEIGFFDCIWQFTSSAGFKPGIRMRLYFWLSRPLTSAEMKAWLNTCAIADKSIYTPTQPIYAAPPVLDGIADPVPRRSGIIGLCGAVVPPVAICAGKTDEVTIARDESTTTPHSISNGAATELVHGPQTVVWDDPETIAWGTAIIEADVAEHGHPKIHERSDNRAYALIGKLKDGPAWGKSLKPETIAALLRAHWAPSFDLWWLLEKAKGKYQNDPGVGPAGSASRIFGGADEVPADAGANDDADGAAADETAGTASDFGPIPPPDTHQALVDALTELFVQSWVWRYNADDHRWYKFDSISWKRDTTVLGEICDFCEPVADQILRTVSGPDGARRHRALLHVTTWKSLKQALQERSEVVVLNEAFDANSHLLNTPATSIDVRKTAMVDQRAPLMMRHCTGYTPDLAARGDYDKACPHFMALLKTLANSRDWVIPFLHLWFGLNLTGERLQEHVLFLEGPPGTGKSVLLRILLGIAGSYGLLLDDRFLVKGRSDKRFDMAPVIGKRCLVKDETQKGSTWDESRLCAIANGSHLVCEFKNGEASVPFKNQTTLTMAGNHRPHFVSPEAGGLTSRMLLLEIDGPSFRNTEDEIHNLAELILKEEGPAITMWALEGARKLYLDHQAGDREYARLVAPMLEATREDATEGSPYQAWAEAEMRLNSEAQIDLVDALAMYKEWHHRTRHELSRDNWSDMKKALARLYPTLRFGKRTTMPIPGGHAFTASG